MCQNVLLILLDLEKYGCNMESLKTLVLRKDYQAFNLFPISCINARDAITRVISGSCEVIANYDIRIKTANKDLEMYWPSVIRSLDANVKHFRNIPQLDPEPLYYRDHNVCQYCSKPLTIPQITMDHVYPVSKGGPTSWDNIVAACNDCNSRKGNQLPVGQWQPKQKPYTPSVWDLIKIRKTYPVTIPHESWKDWINPWPGGILIKEAA